MRQLELDFEAILGVVHLAPYIERRRPMKRCASGQVTASISAFPPSRQRSTIKGVVLGLQRFRGKRRVAYWNGQIDLLRDQLRLAAMSDSEIRRELLAFRAAVEQAINPDQQADPQMDGAA
ncbi:DUF6074 family protein [Mesorhizobium sp. ASY16-5R]|uniref:DUF6074 family protein n=1 Tax=Mesorhizobium sp. ASY16-5R TaxID=3445772 RepID=UPI003FA155D3